MLINWQQWIEITAPWVAPKWLVMGMPVSLLEAGAVILGLLMIWGNFKVSLWAWPLAFTSSFLYALLFMHAKLYGEACLQLVFMAMAVWGAWQWLYGQVNPRTSEQERSARLLHVRSLPPAGRGWAVLSIAALWPLLGFLLDNATDSDAPYWDALPTAGSLVGQYLLGRQWIDNWPCWLLVNMISMTLFAYKGLWLTTILYGVFAMLSVVGWWHWYRLTLKTTKN